MLPIHLFKLLGLLWEMRFLTGFYSFNYESYEIIYLFLLLRSCRFK